MSQTTINQRVEVLIKELEKGNQSAFGRAIDVASGTVAGIIGAKQVKPGFDIVQKISKAYPKVRLEWLLHGEGPMLASNSAGYIGKYPLASPANNVMVPVILSRSRNRMQWDYLRRNEGSDDPEMLKYNEPFDTMTMPPSLLEAGEHIVFQVPGNFMFPTFEADDLVLLRAVPQEEWGSLAPDTVCYLEVHTKTTRTVEFCRPAIDMKAKTVWCYYDNRQWHPRKYPFSEVVALWRFEWRLSPLAENSSTKLYQDIATLQQEVGLKNKVIERLLRDSGQEPSTETPVE